MRLERTISAAIAEGRYYREGERTMVRDQPGAATIRKIGHDPINVPYDKTMQYMIASKQFPKPRTSAVDTDLSPCRTCGGISAGTKIIGGWREHPGCKGLDHSGRVRVAASHHGLGDVDEVVAEFCPPVVMRYADQHIEPTFDDKDHDRTPWPHVRRRALKKALKDAQANLAAWEAASRPKPCTLGRCAICGVAESTGWGDYGHRWTDGTDAALCERCGSEFERYGTTPAFWDEQRAVIVAALTDTGIAPTARAEEISLEAFCALTRRLSG